MVTLPVKQSDGCALLSLDRVPEDHLDDLDGSAPLTASLVVLWDASECLLVFNRFGRVWELPGGMLEAGESARQAAHRELLEESGQLAAALDFVGLAQVWYAPADRFEQLAIFSGSVASRVAFVPNAEMTGSTWWRPGTPIEDLAPIDAALIELCSLS